jgi:hypothetical protein
MPLIEPDWNPPVKMLRVFAVGQLAVFTFVGYAFVKPALPYLAGYAAIFLVVSLIAPRIARYPYVAFTALMLPIGLVVGHVVLGIVYFGIFSPLALVFRFMGRDELGLRFDRTTNTYFQKRAPQPPAKRYFRQF